MTTPPDKPVNSIDAVIAYHERTKHHFHRYAASSGHLDWANQPDPFRKYEGAAQIPLSLESSPQPVAYDQLFETSALPSQPVNLETISNFLRYSLALSAWKESGASRWALRVNPSSGNLHPTEVYLVLESLDDEYQEPGLYHYVSETHLLEWRATFSRQLWQPLMEKTPAGSFLVGLSSILWREAWKYGERAFRYCQHDMGHAIAALRFSAVLNGWQFRLVSGWSSDDMAALLGLDREEDFVLQEREEPELLAVVVTQPEADLRETCVEPPADETIRLIRESRWFGRANRLSREYVNWPVIDEVADATRTPRGAGFPELPRNSGQQQSKVSVEPMIEGRAAHQIILQRRSCLSLDDRSSISNAAFVRMMTRTLPGPHPPWDALGWSPLIQLALFVHRVDGLKPGIYALIRDQAKRGKLQAAMSDQFQWKAPPGVSADFPLHLLAETDCRDAARQLSCHQEIASDGFFSLGMIAEFAEPIRQHGAWLYRHLFWEAGIVGQVLYLEAEAAGCRSTGIGCYFDDPVHDVLGLKGDQFQSLYHFTVGVPVDDPRLRSLPAYSRSRAR